MQVVSLIHGIDEGIVEARDATNVDRIDLEILHEREENVIYTGETHVEVFGFSVDRRFIGILPPSDADLQFDLIEPCPEASAAAVTRRVRSVATEVYRQFLGQDLHLLDDDAFHGAPYR